MTNNPKWYDNWNQATNNYVTRLHGNFHIAKRNNIQHRLNLARSKFNNSRDVKLFNRRLRYRDRFNNIYSNGLFVNSGFGWSHFVALKFVIMLILILGLISTLLTPDLERSPFQSALSIGQVFSEYGTRARDGIIEPILSMRSNLDWVLDKVGSFSGIYQSSFGDGIVTFFRLFTVPFTFSWYILKMLFTVVSSFLWLFFALFGAVMGV